MSAFRGVSTNKFLDVVVPSPFTHACCFGSRVSEISGIGIGDVARGRRGITLIVGRLLGCLLRSPTLPNGDFSKLPKPKLSGVADSLLGGGRGGPSFERLKIFSLSEAFPPDGGISPRKIGGDANGSSDICESLVGSGSSDISESLVGNGSSDISESLAGVSSDISESLAAEYDTVTAGDISVSTLSGGTSLSVNTSVFSVNGRVAVFSGVAYLAVDGRDGVALGLRGFFTLGCLRSGDFGIRLPPGNGDLP
jgi:hypothetical protein